MNFKNITKTKEIIKNIHMIFGNYTIKNYKFKIKM